MTAYLDRQGLADYLKVSYNMIPVLVEQGVLPAAVALTERLKRWDVAAVDAKLAARSPGNSEPPPPGASASDISRRIADDIISERRQRNLRKAEGARRRKR